MYIGLWVMCNVCVCACTMYVLGVRRRCTLASEKIVTYNASFIWQLYGPIVWMFIKHIRFFFRFVLFVAVVLFVVLWRRGADIGICCIDICQSDNTIAG